MIITEENYLSIAMNYYENSTMESPDEFKADLQKASLIQRQLKKYLFNGCINTRLLINHFICFNNVFGLITKKLLIHLVNQKYHKELYSLLFIFGYNNEPNVPINEELVKLIYKEIK